jgi:hypothetical protein
MTDFNPPSPPLSPEKKDTVTLSKKNLAIAFFAAAFVLLFIVLAIPSSNSDDKSSVATDSIPVATQPPVQTSPVNKYDDYVNYVLNNSGKANTWSRADVIEFGDLVCQSLDNGNSIRSVVNLLNGYANSNSDAELFASVMIGSINNLCPEYKTDLNYYLNN